MRLFISAGEPSGDLHGANLIKALKRLNPNIECVGFGGDKMEAAGAKLLFPLTKLAVMWFLHALLNIVKFVRLGKQAHRYFREQKPDALILIDFPGFHFALAKRAHAEGIPVYWFVPPQLWAWAGWRVKKMHKWVDEILCALPFEADWYQKQGCKATFIGHPYFDELLTRKRQQNWIDEQQRRPGRIIALLPGSRMQEVHKNFPSMVRAAQIIHQTHPETRFLVPSFNEAQAEVAREMIGSIPVPIDVHVNKTPEIIETVEMCISCSGSVSLELMFHNKPTVILYKLGPVSLKVGKFFMKCKYITLVNLLADKEIYPEFLTDHDPYEQMAAKINDWLDHPEMLQTIKQQLAQVKELVAKPGACDRAAQLLLERLTNKLIRQAA